MSCSIKVLMGSLLMASLLSPLSGAARDFKMIYAASQGPEPLYPIKLNHQIKANKAFSFKWRQDEQAEYAYILIKPIDAPPLETDGLLKIDKGSEAEVKQGLKAGHYEWQITTGVKGEMEKVSESIPFSVYAHVIEKDGFKLEYGVSNARFSKNVRTERATPEPNFNLADQMYLHELTGYYIFTDWFGLGADWQIVPSGDIPWGRRFYKASAYLHVIGGSSYYAHLFAIGYREMVTYESYSKTLGQNTPLILRGLVIGNEFSWAISRKFKFNIKLQYFKPITIKESLGNFNSDVVEKSIGFGYNVWDMLWVNLFYRQSQTYVSFAHKDLNGKRTRWTTIRTEPVYLSVSYNY